MKQAPLLLIPLLLGWLVIISAARTNSVDFVDIKSAVDGTILKGTYLAAAKPAGIEVRSEVCRWIRYVLVLSGEDTRTSSATTFVNLRNAGMPALDVIRSITTNAAEMLGWQDRIGALEPGKFVDLIAVAGDPIADIAELDRVRFVMKGGQVIRNDLASH